MNKIRNYAYIAVFLVIIIGLGFLSYRKLTKFYINQEKDYNEWTPDLGSKFETDIASTFFNKFGFVNLNGAVCNALNQPCMNGVVKLNNGYLLTTLPYSSDEVLRTYADSTIRFDEYLKNNNYNNLKHFDNENESYGYIDDLLKDGDLVLFKGSHGMHLSNIIKYLVDNEK